MYRLMEIIKIVTRASTTLAGPSRSWLVAPSNFVSVITRYQLKESGLGVTHVSSAAGSSRNATVCAGAGKSVFGGRVKKKLSEL